MQSLKTMIMKMEYRYLHTYYALVYNDIKNIIDTFRYTYMCLYSILKGTKKTINYIPTYLSDRQVIFFCISRITMQNQSGKPKSSPNNVSKYTYTFYYDYIKCKKLKKNFVISSYIGNMREHFHYRFPLVFMFLLVHLLLGTITYLYLNLFAHLKLLLYLRHANREFSSNYDSKPLFLLQLRTYL